LALRSLGASAEEIDRTEDMYRARDKERLRIQVEAGDIRAARTMVAEQQPWGNDR
jgi:glutathione-regulated potassium-efflux system protein KefB